MPKHQKPDRAADADRQDVRAKLLEIYSERAVDHMLNPRNMRPVPQADGQAKADSGHGETVEFFLRLEGGLIIDCAFQTDGCAATLACASAATELAVGLTLDEAPLAVTAERVLQALGGLPPGNVHCGALVAQAFRSSVADARDTAAEPWKKLYRRT
jgi:NifU-like protein involved in Fe-S cluster formation